MFFGLLLIVVGIAFLLENLGLVSGNVWNIIWPLVIILFGISILLKPILQSNNNKNKKTKT